MYLHSDRFVYMFFDTTMPRLALSLPVVETKRQVQVIKLSNNGQKANVFHVCLSVKVRLKRATDKSPRDIILSY